jgi:hypothetical protein
LQRGGDRSGRNITEADTVDRSGMPLEMFNHVLRRQGLDATAQKRSPLDQGKPANPLVPQNTIPQARRRTDVWVIKKPCAPYQCTALLFPETDA